MVAIKQPSEHEQLLHANPITRHARRDSLGSQQQEQVLDVFRRPHKDGSTIVDSWRKGVESPWPTEEDDFGFRKTTSSRAKLGLNSSVPHSALEELRVLFDKNKDALADNHNDNRTEEDTDNEENSDDDNGTETMEKSKTTRVHKQHTSRSEAAKERARNGVTAIDTASGPPRPDRYHSRTNSSATVLLHLRKGTAASESDEPTSPMAYRRNTPRTLRTQRTRPPRTPMPTPMTPPRPIENPFKREDAQDFTDFNQSVDEAALLSSSFTTRLGRNGTCDSNMNEAVNRLLLERMGAMEKVMKVMMEIMQKERRGR